MSLINILNKMNIDVDTTTEVYPAVVKQEDKPIGFINENLSVSLIKEVSEELQEKIENAINFEKGNFHLQEINGEYQVSFFDDTVLTTSFNIDTGKEQYSLYNKDGAGELVYIKTIEDRATATKEFAEISGMSNPDHKLRMPEKIKVENIDRFVSIILDKGFNIKDPSNSLSETDITDKNGDLVAYINKNKDLVITSTDKEVISKLNKYQNQVKDSLIKFPPVIEKFRDKLKAIGLSLKAVFKRDEISYNITDKENKKVAVMDNKFNIKFTPYTTEQIRTNIKNIANELNNMQYNNIKMEQPIQTLEEEKVAHREPLKDDINISEDKKLEQILERFTPQEREVLEKFLKLLSSDDISLEQNKEIVYPEVTQRTQEETREAHREPILNQNNISISNEIDNNDIITNQTKEFNDVMRQIGELNTDGIKLTPVQQKVFEDFDKQVTLIKTLVGFNNDEYKMQLDDLKTKYGTVNAKEFINNLKNDKYTVKEKVSLKDRINDAGNKLDEINKSNEQQKSVNLEMER